MDSAGCFRTYVPFFARNGLTAAEIANRDGITIAWHRKLFFLIYTLREKVDVRFF